MTKYEIIPILDTFLSDGCFFFQCIFIKIHEPRQGRAVDAEFTILNGRLLPENTRAGKAGFNAREKKSDNPFYSDSLVIPEVCLAQLPKILSIFLPQNFLGVLGHWEIQGGHEPGPSQRVNRRVGIEDLGPRQELDPSGLKIEIKILIQDFYSRLLASFLGSQLKVSESKSVRIPEYLVSKWPFLTRFDLNK